MNKLMSIMVLSCQKATFLIEKSYDKPLSFVDRLQLRVHLKICDKCAAYQKQSLLIEQIIESNRKERINNPALSLSNDAKSRMNTTISENLKKM